MYAPTGAEPRRTLAGVVTFRPDPAALQRLVAAVAGDVLALVIVANSPLSPDLKRDLARAAAGTPLLWEEPEQNIGLGTAYNAILGRAAAAGADWALLLDQDSTPGPGMVRDLERVADRLRQEAAPLAIVGPTPIDARGRRYKMRLGTAPARLGARPAEFLNSSGSLISLEAFRDVGPFPQSFFIDAIDIEWCYRAASRGWSIFVADEVVMPHSLGSGVHVLPAGLRVVRQPPERIYTYLRNQLALLRLPHVPFAWKARFALTLPLRLAVYLWDGRFDRAIRTAIRLGLADGSAGRFPYPPDVWKRIRGP